jgi:serine protease Do
MRNGFVGGASAVAFVAMVIAATPAVEAQGRGRMMRWMPEMMMLQDGGSEIGVSVRDLTNDEIVKAKLAQPGGVLVQEVREDSAASRAGLMEGDIVVEFDGERVRGVRHFARLVRETPPGRAVTSSIVRAGSRRDLEITPQAGDRLATGFPDARRLEQRLRALPELRDRSQSPGDLDPTPDLQVSPRGQIGITLAPLTAQLATYFGVKEGVLVSSVTTDSAAAQAGMRAGDVITAVNGRPAQSVADVTRAVRAAKPGSALDLRVFRDNKEITLKVLVPELISEPRSVLPV